MKSLPKKAVATAYNKLWYINDLLNWPDPRFVSYKENGKDKKIENLNLDADSCHNFIGKMKINGTGTYSDEVISAMIKYFFDHTKKWEKVVIEIANKVSELLNWEESMDGYFTSEKQKEHILSLAKEISKKRVKDLQVVDIQDNNKRLFETLENQWLQWLEGWNLPDFNQNFDSLDIAKYLYSIALQDPKYVDEIKLLKSDSFNGDKKDSDYYGLIEMAIRINALLHGITLQWGVARQKKYDALLLKHINPYTKDFPLLADFKKSCRDFLKWKSFKGLYFDTQESEKYINKLDKKSHIQSKTRNALLLTLGLTIEIWASYFTGKYNDRKKQKAMTEETIKDIFENKNAFRSGQMAWWEYKGKEKIEAINGYTENIYERFLFRYGSIWDFSEKAFKAKILDGINDQEVLGWLWCYGCSDICVEDRVIDEVLIPRNIGEFRANNVPMIPYQKYVSYTDAFINTFLLEDDIETTWDQRNISFWWKRDQINMAANKDLWDYALKDFWYYGFRWQKYRIALHKDKRGKQYIVSTGVYYGDFSEKENNNLSTKWTKELAKDFIKQTNPVIRQVLDQYILRYFRWDNLNSSNGYWYNKSKLDRKLEDLLIKDFVKKWLLYKIDQKDIETINEYLDKFVIEYNDNLLDLWLGVNPNLLPNGFLEKYEEAMQNTLQDWDNVFRNNPWLPVSTYLKKEKVVKHLWKYLASDGKKYAVGCVTISGKTYLYAEQEWRISKWDTSYGYYYGEMVSKDYFETKKKFLEEKEKK